MSIFAEHLAPEFRDAFPTWQSLREYINKHAHTQEYPPERAMQQLLMGDLLNQLNQGRHDWLLFGSLALPARPDPADPWPADFRTADGPVEDAYLMARTAFDLDLFATHLGPEAGDYGREVVDALHTAAPPVPRRPDAGLGLGGLVRYSANALRVHDTGQVMGTVNAQPIDDRHGSAHLTPVDDPWILEIDIKPPSKIRFSGPPEPAHRSILGLEVPGVAPMRPLLYPLVNQVADKVVLLTGPPTSLRGTTDPAWHRYKDLVDLHFVVRTCRLDGPTLRDAIEHNWNWRRLGTSELPHPYRVYGQPPVQPGEPAVPWHAGIEELRERWPQLRAYPSFPGMIENVRRFAAGISDPSHQSWAPAHGWTTTQAPGPSAAVQLARQAFPERDSSATAPPTTPDHAAQPPRPRDHGQDRDRDHGLGAGR